MSPGYESETTIPLKIAKDVGFSKRARFLAFNIWFND
jgi:hypothetical protein